jgi:hypothetical protein
MVFGTSVTEAPFRDFYRRQCGHRGVPSAFQVAEAGGPRRATRPPGVAVADGDLPAGEAPGFGGQNSRRPHRDPYTLPHYEIEDRVGRSKLIEYFQRWRSLLLSTGTAGVCRDKRDRITDGK